MAENQKETFRHNSGSPTQTQDDWAHGMEGQISSKKIWSIELEALLLLGSNVGRINNLISDHLPIDVEGLTKDFKRFRDEINTKMPPLAVKDITWKTMHLTHNIMVGDEPDDHDSEDDSEANTEGSGDWSSPYCTDNDSSTDTSDGASYHVILSPNSQSVVPADLPLLPPIRDGHDVPEKGSIIFSNASFEICLTLNAGWGAFAKKKLFQGDKILVERALYHATFEEVQSSVRQLPEHEKKVANSLHAYYGRYGESKEEAIWSTNAFASKYPKSSNSSGSKSLSTDVAGLFPVAARFNHSCEPMVEYKYCAKEEVLVFTVRAWEVEEGQELTISYGKDPSVLYYRFGFNCSCGYCSGFDESKWNF